MLAIFVVASCALSQSFFHLFGIASVCGGEESKGAGILRLGSLGICVPAVILSCDVVSSPDITPPSSRCRCCRKSTHIAPITAPESGSKLEELTALSNKSTSSWRPVEKVQAHNAVIEYRLPSMPSNMYIRKKYSRLSYDLDSDHPIQLLVSKVFSRYALLKYHHRNCGPFWLCLATFIIASATATAVVCSTLLPASDILPHRVNCSCLTTSILSSMPSISEETVLAAIYCIIALFSCAISFYAVFLKGETIIYNYEPMRPSPEGAILATNDTRANKEDDKHISLDNYGAAWAEA
jgi:hypothetical protein